MTPALITLQSSTLTDPFIYHDNPIATTVDTLTQEYIFLQPKLKDTYLVHLLMEYIESDAIIFVSTCGKCQLISELLQILEFKCVCLHSQMTQNRRLAALAKFKSRQVNILVATDVASRGLDIPTVELVINFDIPSLSTNYIHRVGRTARQGRGGRAISLITPSDVDLVHKIEEKIEKKMTECEIKEDDALLNINKVTKARHMAKMSLIESGFEEKIQKNKEKRKANDEEDRSHKKVKLAVL